MKITAIIGFGFCGRLAFFHLAKKTKNEKILIFDKNGRNALGPAFTSFSPHYILNVPTIKMSAFSEAPRNFCQFLEKNYPQVWQEIGENGFAPRWLYGKYLEQLTEEAFLAAEKNNIEVEFVSAEVSEIQPGFVINQSFKADEILLATSFIQSDLPFDFAAPQKITKLWDKNSQQFHQKNFTAERICLIGSGLTAVDVIIGLKKKNFAGKILVISRRGNFPKKHFTKILPIPNFISAADAQKGLLFLCQKIRNFLRTNPQYDLRHAVDSLRHITQDLWHNFDTKNKKLFLRLAPYWNIFRHRAPASSIAVIEEMIKNGQIEIQKKALRKSDESACKLVVNCLGFEFKTEKYSLLQQMLAINLLKKDVILVQSNHPKIKLLGGLNIGRDFECTSVPDLRLSVENSL